MLSRHCYHTQRIAFAHWKRVLPVMVHENYEEEKRDLAKVKEFRDDFLLKSCFRALLLNKEDEKRDRLMAQHRNNLRGKISEWTKDDSKVDVDKLFE